MLTESSCFYTIISNAHLQRHQHVARLQSPVFFPSDDLLAKGSTVGRLPMLLRILTFGRSARKLDVVWNNLR